MTAPMNRRIQPDPEGPVYLYRGRLSWGPVSAAVPNGDTICWSCLWCGAWVDDHAMHTSWHRGAK